MRALFQAGVAAAVVAFGSSGAAAQPADTWKAALLADAQAVHDTFLDSHPGAFDENNPSFRPTLASGLARAQAHAATVDSFAGYRWALREYAAAFDDAHVDIRDTAKSPQIPLEWPGFLTRERDGRHVVAAKEEGSGGPALGAVLISCDNRPAAELAAETVGRFRGLWNLESRREAQAWRLFLDADNPLVERPSRCVFDEGGARTYTLAWKPLTQKAFEAEAKRVSATFRTDVGLRPFGSAGLWVSAGTFNAGSADGKQLEALIKALGADSSRLRAAEVVVLDVRGNGGGSSEWGRRIAEALWGEANAASASPRSGGVDWRASSANIAAMQALKAKPGAGLVMRVWAGNVIRGMQRARQAGQTYWRETSPLGGLLGKNRGSAARPVHPAKFNTRARVYVLTDASCASACLDALDLWKALGAVHVGRETSADSLYMEVRDQVLPSGYSTLSVPMKVYRGRKRGLNEPHRPAHRLELDMSDTAALEAEILRLARSPTP